jgi:hypothetical protein
MNRQFTNVAAGRLIQPCVGWTPAVYSYHILHAAAWGTIVVGWGVGDESLIYFRFDIEHTSILSKL